MDTKILNKLSLITSMLITSVLTTSALVISANNPVRANQQVKSCIFGGGLLTVVVPTTEDKQQQDLVQVKLITPGAYICKKDRLYVRVSAHQEAINAFNLKTHLNNSLTLSNPAAIK